MSGDERLRPVWVQEDFPLPDRDTDTYSTRSLVRAIEEVRLASHRDPDEDCKLVLKGVCFEFYQQGVEVRAMDGKRLAAAFLPGRVSRVSQAWGETLSAGAILALRTGLVNKLSKGERVVEARNVACEGLKIGGSRFETIVDGFPELKEKWLPRSGNGIEFNRLDMLERLGKFKQERPLEVELGEDVVDRAGEKLALLSQWSKKSSLKKILLVEGERFNGTSLNPRHFNDVLKVVKADRFTLSTDGGNNPIVIRPVDDPFYIYITMPYVEDSWVNRR